METLTHVTHVNGWFPAVYMSYMSQNFRLFHVSNLPFLNFRIFLLMYPGPALHRRVTAASAHPPARVSLALSPLTAALLLTTLLRLVYRAEAGHREVWHRARWARRRDGAAQSQTNTSPMFLNGCTRSLWGLHGGGLGSQAMWPLTGQSVVRDHWSVVSGDLQMALQIGVGHRLLLAARPCWRR